MLRRLISTVVATITAVPLCACASAAGPRQLRAGPGANPAGASDWSRVIALTPATRVVATVRGTDPRVRWIVRADDSSVTMLDLAAENVPEPVARVLLRMAEEHPESFATMRAGQTFQQGNIRIGRDGVFDGGRKVAAFDEVVESIARSEVVEIRGPVVARGSVLGALVGAWLGFSVGVVPGLGGAPPAAAWLALAGSTAAGGFLGSHWSSHRVEGLIYRAAPAV